MSDGGNRPEAIAPEGQPNRLLRTLIVVALVALGIWLWDANKYRIFPKRWGEVVAGRIYRSGQLHPDLVEKTLHKHGIKTVVSLTGSDPNDPYQTAENRTVSKLDVDFHRFPLSGDGTGDVQQYIEALLAIVAADTQGCPVLVHCAAGSQRTGAAIAFYRLLVEGRDPTFVYRELRRYDWRDKPDGPLITYINEHIGVVAQALHQAGAIAEVPAPLPQLRSRHRAEPRP